MNHLTEREVRTRKPHRCEWCGQVIPKGTRCHYRSYIWDGELQWGWSHFECWDAQQESDHEILAAGWMPGDFERGEPAL